MLKGTEGRGLACSKLTLLEKVTKGLIENSDEETRFVIKEGRVFLKASVIRKDSFVMEYTGDIISEAEGISRMTTYVSSGENYSILYFTFEGINMAIDASKTKAYGRFLSSSSNPNIQFYKPLTVDWNSVLPKIAAYALRDIQQGEEIVVGFGIPGTNCEDGYDVTSIDSEEDFELSSKISTLKSFCNEASGSSGLSSVNNTGCHSRGAIKNYWKRKLISTGEFAYSFKNLAPEGFKKSYFAAYQHSGVPDRITRLPECLSKVELLKYNHILNPAPHISHSTKPSMTEENKTKKVEIQAPSSSFKSTPFVQIENNPKLFDTMTCQGNRSFQAKYKKARQETPSNSCYGDADQTDILNTKDDQSGTVSTGLRPYIKDIRGRVAANGSSDYNLENVSPSLSGVRSSSRVFRSVLEVFNTFPYTPWTESV